MSPLSSNPSLRIDTSLHHHLQQQQQLNGQGRPLPRTASTNGSINTLRPYRRAMTPRVGIRTSVFGGIEVRNLTKKEKRHLTHVACS